MEGDGSKRIYLEGQGNEDHEDHSLEVTSVGDSASYCDEVANKLGIELKNPFDVLSEKACSKDMAEIDHLRNLNEKAKLFEVGASNEEINLEYELPYGIGSYSMGLLEFVSVEDVDGNTHTIGVYAFNGAFDGVNIFVPGLYQSESSGGNNPCFSSEKILEVSDRVKNIMKEKGLPVLDDELNSTEESIESGKIPFLYFASVKYMSQLPYKNK